ncbi:NAD-dependent epimerase/dehydratase family protein [Catenulispora rubra]|uniref:NAD-dependent epimerase/dehydratase family protein n=1 Tax=Catenulispora rubra TaxID=280293 RepID=UPI001892787F|nr:NAD-dependent epimerase/dehydratase family protein [Catenulispora rubra]
MRILILGGTWFLGRALAASAIEHGHQVTVFNRGRSGVDPDGAAAIRGDRESDDDLKRLTNAGSWDVVVDPSGQVPRVVLASARALAGSGRYIFVSSVSAYTGWPIDPLTETSALLESRADAGPEFGYTDPRGYPTQYGFAKAGCEQAVLDVFGPDRATILRPGVILGPWEYVGRLPWWLRRIAEGGRVLAPGDPDQLIQPVDVRDVADFAIRAAKHGLGGAFNVTAPANHTTFAGFLEACRQATGSDAEFVWIGDDQLAAAGIRQWTEIPLWRSADAFPGTWKVSSAKAATAGLTARPIRTTAADTWQWLTAGGQAVASERVSELGIDPEREAEILAGARG